MIFHVIFKRLLLVVFLTLNVCDCIEETAPEVYLNPRNFNPHPYENGYNSNRNVDSNGPVLFPITRDDQQEDYYRNGISNVINEHPYASVARKNMIQSGQLNKVTRVNPEVYKALTMHAAKVLNVPASGINLQYYDNNNNNNGQQYVNGVSYGFLPQNVEFSDAVPLKNYQYSYEIPNETYKPIHEVNAEIYKGDLVNINSFNKIPKETLHYEYDNIENAEPILEYVKPVQRFYEVDNTKDTLYNANDKGYSQIYIKTPKFRLLQRQSHVSG